MTSHAAQLPGGQCLQITAMLDPSGNVRGAAGIVQYVEAPAFAVGDSAPSAEAAVMNFVEEVRGAAVTSIQAAYQSNVVLLKTSTFVEAAGPRVVPGGLQHDLHGPFVLGPLFDGLHQKLADTQSFGALTHRQILDESAARLGIPVQQGETYRLTLRVLRDQHSRAFFRLMNCACKQPFIPRCHLGLISPSWGSGRKAGSQAEHERQVIGGGFAKSQLSYHSQSLWREG